MSQKHELIEFARMETYRKKDIRLESVKWGEIFQFLETSGFHVLGSYINLSIVLVDLICISWHNLRLSSNNYFNQVILIFPE